MLSCSAGIDYQVNWIVRKEKEASGWQLHRLRIDTDVVGPGFAATWFTGLIDTLVIGCAVPTSPDTCELRLSFVVRDADDEAATRSLGTAFADEIHERTIEDVEIWEAKAYIARPALAYGDGPIMQYRRWCEQFYVGEVDRSQETWAPARDFAQCSDRS